MPRKPNLPSDAVELRRHAEARLRERRSKQRTKAGNPKSEADPRRLLHELQVHQVELEVQNAELQDARNRMEVLLEKYTDLYDFAPVGYFSVDEQGRILEVNLTGANLLGVERSLLISRRLPRFVVPESQPTFEAFLKRVFAGTGKQVCEAALFRKDAAPLWASFHGSPAISVSGPPKWCRVAVSDITSLKQGEEAKSRMEALAVANRELRREIDQRQAVEKSLRESEQHYSRLLKESRQMQDQLRLLSRQILTMQEEERKKISRELHDVIAQSLTGINVRLAGLKKQATSDTRGLERSIARTQRLVQQSVDIIHRFARTLRPTVLDDLGLIPALHTFMKYFKAETGIQVSLSAFAAVEQLGSDKRTALFRVVQEALTNVARHAQANSAEVKLQKVDGAVCMSITDDGKGFHAERRMKANKGKGLGLLGMRERLEIVGGKFTLTSAPGKGTTVCAQIPLIDRGSGGGGGRSRANCARKFSTLITVKRITVLLAEDHPIVRLGFRALLSHERDIEVVGEAATGREAVQLTRKLRPAVVVMDIAMPLLNGLEATRQILRDFPDTRVLILSAHGDEAYVERAIELGAAGFFRKQSASENLAVAIREVQKGNPFFSSALSKRLRGGDQKTRDLEGPFKKRSNRLSSREVEVLQLIAEGKPNKQVAAELGVSFKTVDKHRQHLMAKLNIHDVSGLTRYAIAEGIIEGSVPVTIS